MNSFWESALWIVALSAVVLGGCALGWFEVPTRFSGAAIASATTLWVMWIIVRYSRFGRPSISSWYFIRMCWAPIVALGGSFLGALGGGFGYVFAVVLLLVALLLVLFRRPVQNTLDSVLSHG
jgi:hypothetical protein